MAKEFDLEVKIDLEMGECWICEAGTYKSCSYTIDSIKEVSNSVEDYITTYIDYKEE